MLDSLSDRLGDALGDLRSSGRLSEEDLDKAIREIRLALLEADVNFDVVKQFVATVKERARGAEVADSLTPGQQVVKIVNEELIALLSGGDRTFHLSGNPGVVMLVGLQGSGKTTSSAKLARQIVKLGRRPLLVRSGGTIPVVPALSHRGIPAIVTGFGLPDAQIHSPNERLVADYVPLGIATARELFRGFAAL